MNETEQGAQVTAAEGERREMRDRAMATYDEEAVRDRLIGAMSELLRFGFGVDLLARPVRGATEYRLRLVRDGHGERPMRTVQTVADRFNLDLLVETADAKLEMIMYPRAGGVEG